MSDFDKREKTRNNVEMIRKCHNCDKFGEDFPKCSGCKSVYYCSRECQKTDWKKRHKKICKKLKEQRKFISSNVQPLLKSMNKSSSRSSTVLQVANLHAAAYNGQVDIVKRLLQKGINVNAFQKNNWTALHHATKGGHCLSLIHISEPTRPY